MRLAFSVGCESAGVMELTLFIEKGECRCDRCVAREGECTGVMGLV